MINIIIKKKVEIAGSPRFVKGQKVRVAEHVAKLLIDRKFAVVDEVGKISKKTKKK